MTYTTLVENKHGVPIKQWNEWNARERAMFNTVHGSTMEVCKFDDDAETISWEAAATAACTLNHLDKRRAEWLTHKDGVF